MLQPHAGRGGEVSATSIRHCRVHNHQRRRAPGVTAFSDRVGEKVSALARCPGQVDHGLRGGVWPPTYAEPLTVSELPSGSIVVMSNLGGQPGRQPARRSKRLTPYSAPALKPQFASRGASVDDLLASYRQHCCPTSRRSIACGQRLALAAAV